MPWILSKIIPSDAVTEEVLFLRKSKAGLVFNRAVLDSVNFGRFVSRRCERFHCNAMRTSIKTRMNWHKIQQSEHTPEKFFGIVTLEAYRLIRFIAHKFRDFGE